MAKKQRLDKILAHSGVGTRSQIKLLVKQGAISVNGKKVKDSGVQIDPETDILEVDGERILYREFVYLMLNKPPGVISATEDNRDRTVIDLLTEDYLHFEVFPVGRLDKDTEGLLLLTNDGKLAHNLLSPRKHVPKTYYAEVKGPAVDEADIEAFSKGVTLDDGYETMPAELVIIEQGQEHGSPSKIQLTIKEGKFHQVKRMFQSVGKEVVYLKRMSMGALQLDPDLALGQFRELTDEELKSLSGNNEEG